jgi:hypothetical protein
MEGLFFESSATTPYHFLNQSELSKVPSRAQRSLPYRDLNVAGGVAHLQLLGVRYYMAISPDAQAQADVQPDLHLLTTSGPWPVTYTVNGAAKVEQRTWKIYEVANSAQVTPLTELPNVVKGLPKGGKGWLTEAVNWYQDQSRWDVPLAVNGPKSWPRIRMDQAAAPTRVPIAPATVTNISTGDDHISFHVDQIGTPVLVKASYFPNWQASGAKGPWRVSPNLMVVIPTSHHVNLHYGYTPVDGFGWLATLLGLLGVVALVRRGGVEFPTKVRAARLSQDDRAMADTWGRLEDELVAAQVAAGYPWHPVEFEPYGYAVADSPPSPTDAPSRPPTEPAWPMPGLAVWGPSQRPVVPAIDGPRKTNGGNGQPADPAEPAEPAMVEPIDAD